MFNNIDDYRLVIILYDLYSDSDTRYINDVLNVKLNILIADKLLMRELNNLSYVNFNELTDFYLCFDNDGNVIKSNYIYDICDYMEDILIL